MRSFLPLVLFALVAACSNPTRRVDIGDDDELMGTGLESADIEALEQFAKSLLQSPVLTGEHVEGIPVVALFPVENNTSQDFDGELLVRRIRTQLLKHGGGKIDFVVRDKRSLALIEKERTAKRGGEFTSSKQETKTGTDFYLTGKAAENAKAGKGLESRAIWIDFELIDAETGRLVWSDVYKTKKVGEAGVVYR